MNELKTNLTQDQLGQIQELVTFTEDSEGNLSIQNVKGTVCGDVLGNVLGSVKSHIYGSVIGNVWGSVKGSVEGDVKGL